MMLTKADLALYRGDMLEYTCGYFRHFRRVEFDVNWHHRYIANALMRVVAGRCMRLIINIPPRYAKTEMAVISFISWTLGLFPDSEYIYACYSADLASNKSAQCKEVVQSEFYQTVFPGVSISSKSGARKHWETNFGGVVHTAGVGGQTTGYGAGKHRSGFGGAMVIDDAHKPTEAVSEVTRPKVLDWYKNTIVSRLNKRETPIIIIMQRLHDLDLVGWLLEDGNGDAKTWEHIKISALGKDDEALWPVKHNTADLKAMELADNYNFSAQYQQDPVPAGGGLFPEKWWRYYDEEPKVEYKFFTADTAQKEKEHNNFSVIQCWGMRRGRLYLLDQVRGRWRSPELLRQFLAFWEKHLHSVGTTGPHLRHAYIEDKSSGTSLIQEIAERGKIPVVAVERHKDKTIRANDAAPYVKDGLVLLPANAPWMPEYRREFLRFSPLGTHAFDDQVDATVDAILFELGKTEKRWGLW